MRNPTVKLTVQRDKILPDDAIVAATVLTTATTPRENGHLEITIPPKSPGGKVPPIVPVRSPTTALSSPVGGAGEKNATNKMIAPTSTRRIGRKLYIQLMKGKAPSAFSLWSINNISLSIYYKKILLAIVLGLVSFRELWTASCYIRYCKFM